MSGICVYLWFLIQRSEEESQSNFAKKRCTTSVGGASRVSRDTAWERAEMHWRDLADNPSDWWDNLGAKKNPKAPDFKHHTSKRGLWIDNFYTPDWAHASFKALWEMETESHQLSVGLWQSFCEVVVLWGSQLAESVLACSRLVTPLLGSFSYKVVLNFYVLDPSIHDWILHEFQAWLIVTKKCCWVILFKP